MDDDAVSECKKKMSRFRIQELKDVLGQLGLARTGKKQDLVDRVLALLSRDEANNIGSRKKKFIAKGDVITIINETYRKMQDTGAVNVVIGGLSVSDSSSITPAESNVTQKVQCPCGIPQKTEFMIQCADPQCQVLQHIPCVVIPEDSPEGIPSAPFQFYCEVCRINRADPFWKTLAHPLYPVKLFASAIPDDDSQPLQTAETSFQITKADIDLLDKTGCDIQAWCILLNDNVPFRMHWPQYPDLKVNGIPVKTISRPGSKLLGANGRDDGPSIAVYLVEGRNRIVFSCSDARTFCLGVRIVRRRTTQEVLNLIPSEQEGESFTEAVARVCRCIGGGMAAATEDSDSDLEVVADNVTINLRCPMSGSRMKTAARFKGCLHLGCFDLESLVQINERSRKWQCPVCLKNYSLEDIRIDPFLNLVVKMMRACDEDITEIDVKADGSWRAKIGRPCMDLEQWHLPDGLVCKSAIKTDSSMEVPSGKNKHQSGIRENGSGTVVCDDKYGLAITPKSSEINVKDVLESVDHCGTSQQDVKLKHGTAMDSVPCNYYQESGITNRSTSSSQGDPGVIILSDSEEEDNGTQVENAASRADSLRPILNAGASSSRTCDGESSGDPFTFACQPWSGKRKREGT